MQYNIRKRKRFDKSFSWNKKLTPGAGWSNYVKGVVAQYVDDCGGSIGFDAAIYSSVPLGGGLSSSASLEVCTATLIQSLYNLKTSKTERALRCQKAEHTFPKVPCGIMDQFICSHGELGYALLIDCRSPFPTKSVPFDDPGVSLVIANTNKKHVLEGSPYKDRVRQCKEAVAAIQKKHPEVKFLRDCTMEMLDEAKKMELWMI
eukprot:UN28117